MSRKRKRKQQKFTIGMKRKLVVLFLLVLLAFVGLGVRILLINRNNGEEYEKQVLSQQEYDSTTLPFRRGEITDANGTVLAYSEKVYNVILDVKQLLYDEDYLDPTISALVTNFGFDESELRTYISENPTSQYHTLAKELSYEEIKAFKDLQTAGSDTYNSNIQGVWFEETYIRKYPNGSMASDVIGFTTSDNNGLYGLEEYYNDVLSGTPGREYGYIDEDYALERTTIPATDGNSIVTTIDGNLQSIVERYLAEFNEEHKNEAHEGNGANNVGCIIMEVDTGNVLAMASYPNFDLNDTKNTDALIGMPMVDENGNKTGDYITEENLETLEGDVLLQNFNSLWRNFCISDTYEPGSVAKPFTVATGLETGIITGNEVYQCDGYLNIGGYNIKCHNTYGHGPITIPSAIEQSCNVAMMYIGQAIGADIFTKFQTQFGFGLKTNIDLAGEARTEGLTYTADQMGSTELATNTFGQGFNVDMIEMITAFCSLINGGKFYEPHVVSKIVNSSGATVENIEPRVLRETVSESTSEKIIEYCNLVVSGDNGTGKTARPAGYMIGGKTGTAQTLPRGNGEYVVSFMGYAPADDPEIAIYVVVDRPNVESQDNAKYATTIVKKILTEALPYLNYPMTEEVTEEEQAELDELMANIVTPITSSSTEGASGEETVDGDATEGASGSEEGASSESSSDAASSSSSGATDDATTETSQIWKSFEVDPETGYYIDPSTGALINPDNGNSIGGDALPDFDSSSTGSASSSAASSDTTE